MMPLMCCAYCGEETFTIVGSASRLAATGISGGRRAVGVVVI
jgi:hypothetical protein